MLGYDDRAGSATLGEWDEFVIGINFATPVPEPEIYGVMAAGLGMLDWVGRRRKQRPCLPALIKNTAQAP